MTDEDTGGPGADGFSVGGFQDFTRELLGFAKGARDLAESTGMGKKALQQMSTMLLDIEDGVKGGTGGELAPLLEGYFTTLIPPEAEVSPAPAEVLEVQQPVEEVPAVEEPVEEVSAVDRMIGDINRSLSQLYGSGWFRASDKVGHIFRVWEKLVAAGYSLPPEQFDRGSEYYQLLDDFRVRIGQLQPTEESVKQLATMVKPMVTRARKLVKNYTETELPDTGFSTDVRSDPLYVKTLLETVEKRRVRRETGTKTKRRRKKRAEKKKKKRKKSSPS